MPEESLTSEPKTNNLAEQILVSEFSQDLTYASDLFATGEVVNYPRALAEVGRVIELSIATQLTELRFRAMCLKASMLHNLFWIHVEGASHISVLSREYRDRVRPCVETILELRSNLDEDAVVDYDSAIVSAYFLPTVSYDVRVGQLAATLNNVPSPGYFRQTIEASVFALTNLLNGLGKDNGHDCALLARAVESARQYGQDHQHHNGHLLNACLLNSMRGYGHLAKYAGTDDQARQTHTLEAMKAYLQLVQMHASPQAAPASRQVVEGIARYYGLQIRNDS